MTYDSSPSRIALTDGTDRILQPMRFAESAKGIRQICTVSLSNDAQHLRLYFYGRSDQGAIYSPSPRVQRDFVQRFPERKLIDNKSIGISLQVPATDTSAIILLEAWPQHLLKFKDDETQLVLQSLYAHVWAQVQGVQRVADWRAGIMPQHNHALHPNKTLAEYQQVALCNSYGMPGYGLLMEQGSGKTPIVIARICNEAAALRSQQLANGQPLQLYKTIIVCPKNVQMNWVYEFHDFATHAGRINVLRGTKLQRIRVLMDALRYDPILYPQDADELYSVVIVAYDTLPGAWDALALCNWDLAVLDESHYTKDTKTRRYKYCMQLRDMSRQRMVLTGTAVGNSVLDLYSQLEFLGKGYSGFSSFKAFSNFYGVWDKRDTNTGFVKLLGVQNMPFLKERLARCSFVIRKDEALPHLPNKVYDIVEVEMTEEQQNIYDSIASALFVKVEDMLGGDMPKQLMIQNILTQLLRLAEITSGYVKYDAVYNPDNGELLRPAVVDRFDPNPKLEQLVELLKDKPREEKTLVWACFAENIKTIRARLDLEGIKAVTYYGKTSNDDREAAVKGFNCDPDIRVFVGNPGAGGTGLNLIGFDKEAPKSAESSYTNCTQEIFYSQDWSSLKRSQAEDRAHRPQTRVPLRITDLCVPNTVDEEIRQRVLLKRKLGLEVSDLHELIKRLLKR